MNEHRTTHIMQLVTPIIEKKDYSKLNILFNQSTVDLIDVDATWYIVNGIKCKPFGASNLYHKGSKVIL